jgi:hypothetical protein
MGSGYSVSLRGWSGEATDRSKPRVSIKTYREGGREAMFSTVETLVEDERCGGLFSNRPESDS